MAITEVPRVVVRKDSGLYGYERALKRVGLAPVAGADEAGRGACAGPLVAGETVPLTLRFAAAPEVTVQAQVRAPGAAASMAGMDHGGH